MDRKEGKRKGGEGSGKRYFEIEQRNLPLEGPWGCIGRWKSGCFTTEHKFGVSWRDVQHRDGYNGLMNRKRGSGFLASSFRKELTTLRKSGSIRIKRNIPIPPFLFYR